MGAITDAVETVRQRGDLDARQKEVEIGRIRATAHADVVAAAGGRDQLVLDRGDGRVVVLTAMRRTDRAIAFNVAWTIDGAPQPFSNPWIVVNPPCLVPDPLGDIVRVSTNPRTGEPVELRYREDPFAALLEVVDAKFRRQARAARG